MINERDFKNNIEDILSTGIIENKPLSQIDILKHIFKDDNLSHLFFLDFESYFPYEDGTDMLLCKTQDFIYRLDITINDFLIGKHNLNTIGDIKDALLDLIFENADFYSAVSYDDSDKEMLEEFETIFPCKDIPL